jgi:hypothetical protein
VRGIGRPISALDAEIILADAENKCHDLRIFRGD